VKLKLPDSEKLLRAACVLSLIALPMMLWSVFDPTVWPVMLALTVGQGIGTLGFALFVVVVVRDLGLRRKLEGDSSSAP
jgi:hypothetical protein